ncbi:MAG: hypothetical protein M3Y36_02310 [Actinomycetota bacterium]|nr:hypothetical protein [Actinomycetota bacterium]
MTRARAFLDGYDAVAAQWPPGTTALDVRSEFGTTHALVYGPEDGTPLVFLHGGGATPTSWFAAAAIVGRTHRVYALDQIGAPGRSIHDGRAITSTGDLMTGWAASTASAPPPAACCPTSPRASCPAPPTTPFLPSAPRTSAATS